MAQKLRRDYVYLAAISAQLLGMLVLDFVEFYPKALYASPSAPLHFLTSFREWFLEFSGDPFFSPTYVAPWFHAFLHVELLVEFPLAVYLISQLSSSRPSSGPAELAGLVFGCLVGTSTFGCVMELWAMGPDMVKEELRTRLLFGTYLPFFIIPSIMAVDMYLRLLPRVGGQAKSKRV